MIPFITEKQIEAYLVNETRMLPLPGGGEQVMTGPNLMWQAVDFITGTCAFTMNELIGFTRSTMAEKGYTFEEAFKSVVAYIDGRMLGR